MRGRLARRSVKHSLRSHAPYPLIFRSQLVAEPNPVRDGSDPIGDVWYRILDEIKMSSFESQGRVGIDTLLYLVSSTVNQSLSF